MRGEPFRLLGFRKGEPSSSTGSALDGHSFPYFHPSLCPTAAGSALRSGALALEPSIYPSDETFLPVDKVRRTSHAGRAFLKADTHFPIFPPGGGGGGPAQRVAGSKASASVCLTPKTPAPVPVFIGLHLMVGFYGFSIVRGGGGGGSSFFLAQLPQRLFVVCRTICHKAGPRCNQRVYITTKEIAVNSLIIAKRSSQHNISVLRFFILFVSISLVHLPTLILNGY